MQIQLDILYIFPKSSNITEKNKEISSKNRKEHIWIYWVQHTAILRKYEAREAGTEIEKGRGGLDSDFVE